MPKPNSKPIDKEAVRVLAIEIGAREAARKLGLNEDTVCSWSRRLNWKLPKRVPVAGSGSGRKPLAQARLKAIPGDVLLATHEELADRSRTAILQAGTAAAERAAESTLHVDNVKQLQQLTSSLARVLGWGNDSRPSVNYYGDVNQVVVCPPERRAELIEQRQRLLEQEGSKATEACRAKVIDL